MPRNIVLKIRTCQRPRQKHKKLTFPVSLNNWTGENLKNPGVQNMWSEQTQSSQGGQISGSTKQPSMHVPGLCTAEAKTPNQNDVYPVLLHDVQQDVFLDPYTAFSTYNHGNREDHGSHDDARGDRYQNGVDKIMGANQLQNWQSEESITKMETMNDECISDTKTDSDQAYGQQLTEIFTGIKIEPRTENVNDNRENSRNQQNDVFQAYGQQQTEICTGIKIEPHSDNINDNRENSRNQQNDVFHAYGKQQTQICTGIKIEPRTENINDNRENPRNQQNDVFNSDHSCKTAAQECLEIKHAPKHNDEILTDNKCVGEFDCFETEIKSEPDETYSNHLNRSIEDCDATAMHSPKDFSYSSTLTANVEALVDYVITRVQKGRSQDFNTKDGIGSSLSRFNWVEDTDASTGQSNSEYGIGINVIFDEHNYGQGRGNSYMYSFDHTYAKTGSVEDGFEDQKYPRANDTHGGQDGGDISVEHRFDDHQFSTVESHADHTYAQTVPIFCSRGTQTDFMTTRTCMQEKIQT